MHGSYLIGSLYRGASPYMVLFSYCYAKATPVQLYATLDVRAGLGRGKEEREKKLELLARCVRRQSHGTS